MEDYSNSLLGHSIVPGDKSNLSAANSRSLTPLKLGNASQMKFGQQSTILGLNNSTSASIIENSVNNVS